MWGQLRVWYSAVELRGRGGPILCCHTVFTLGWAQASVWSWQAGFRRGKQENGSLALCVSSHTPRLCLQALWKAAVLFAFDKSLTFTGCVEFVLAGPLFKYPLPARIQSAHLWVWKGVWYHLIFLMSHQSISLAERWINTVHLCGSNFRTQVGVYGCLTWHKWTELTPCLEAFDFTMHPGQNSIYVWASCRCSQSV